MPGGLQNHRGLGSTPSAPAIAGTSPGGLSGLISRVVVGSIPTPATIPSGPYWQGNDPVKIDAQRSSRWLGAMKAYIFCEPCQRGEHQNHLPESTSTDGRYDIVCNCDGTECVAEYGFVRYLAALYAPVRDTGS